MSIHVADAVILGQGLDVNRVRKIFSAKETGNSMITYANTSCRSTAIS